MGLFRGAKKDGAGDPIEALVGAEVTVAAYRDKKLDLRFQSKAGEAQLEVSGKFGLAFEHGLARPGDTWFDETLAALPKKKVISATHEPGEALSIMTKFGPGLTVFLTEGTYEGTRAALLKGPGRVSVAYDRRGASKRSP